MDLYQIIDNTFKEGHNLQHLSFFMLISFGCFYLLFIYQKKESRIIHIRGLHIKGDKCQHFSQSNDYNYNLLINYNLHAGCDFYFVNSFQKYHFNQCLQCSRPELLLCLGFYVLVCNKLLSLNDADLFCSFLVCILSTKTANVFWFAFLQQLLVKGEPGAHRLA